MSAIVRLMKIANIFICSHKLYQLRVNERKKEEKKREKENNPKAHKATVVTVITMHASNGLSQKFTKYSRSNGRRDEKNDAFCLVEHVIDITGYGYLLKHFDAHNSANSTVLDRLS